MRSFWLTLPVCIVVAQTALAQENWPEFRGPTQQGHVEAVNLPVEFDDTKNVTWKRPIEGRGHSSPVIWGNQIWITTALEEGKSLHAICLDKETGEIVHDVEVFQNEETINVNAKNSHASPSSVIEEGRVYVHFGTYGTACLNTQTGEKIWENRDLKLNHQEGPGSSPILFQNLLIVNCDGYDIRYVVALDKLTGSIVWKKDRPGGLNETGDINKAFCTPTVITWEGNPLMIDPGAQTVVAYDPRDGNEVWWSKYKGFSVVPRPVSNGEAVFITTGYMKPELQAIKLGGKGDVTESNLLWKATAQVPCNSSLLLAGEELYMVSDAGIASCLDQKTGKVLWTKRLNDSFWASPMDAGGKIYYWGENGSVTVIKAGKKFEQLARNEFPEGIFATPAVSGEALFVRTLGGVYRIEAK
jgi:outer membrane protein assembly factor BamB